MGRGFSTLVGALTLAIGTAAHATDFTAVVVDQDGKPVANAVVSLLTDSTSAPAPASRLANEKTVDQRNETFIPLVTIVPKRGRVVFANNDQTTHQVYSFSKIKQFEITLSRGQTSTVTFENAGVAALGCNIHDNMIAYTFVAESPWTALTGDDGRAVINGVPPGGYKAQVWHPKFAPGHPPPSTNVSLSGDTTRWDATVKLLPPRLARSHGGNY
jgi:plastocyanin